MGFLYSLSSFCNIAFATFKTEEVGKLCIYPP